MRGNHRIWGRNDYVEPAAMPEADRARVLACDVTLRPGYNTVYDVVNNGKCIGAVTTRFAGQLFRRDDNDDWGFVCGDWSRADPQHGKAILALLDAN